MLDTLGALWHYIHITKEMDMARRRKTKAEKFAKWLEEYMAFTLLGIVFACVIIVGVDAWAMALGGRGFF